MNERQVIKMFEEGHSIDYIIGFLTVEWNRFTKQYNSFTRQWILNLPKYSREEITYFVYKTLLNRHISILKGGNL